MLDNGGAIKLSIFFFWLLRKVGTGRVMDRAFQDQKRKDVGSGF
jgi:hypothetical protein